MTKEIEFGLDELLNLIQAIYEYPVESLIVFGAIIFITIFALILEGTYIPKQQSFQSEEEQKARVKNFALVMYISILILFLSALF